MQKNYYFVNHVEGKVVSIVYLKQFSLIRFSNDL